MTKFNSFVQKARKAITKITKKETELVVEVLHDHDLMVSLGLPVIAAALCTDGVERIIVDDMFFTMPSDTQDAFLLHERGHIVLGHLTLANKDINSSRNALAKSGQVTTIELEADAYAAKQLSPESMISALLDFSRFVPNANTVEIDLRIKALRQL